MTSLADLACWEIMKCEETQDCQARKNLNIPCWELAKEFDDHRLLFNICKDCVVYILKGNNAVVSENDIRRILENRGICVFT